MLIPSPDTHRAQGLMVDGDASGCFLYSNIGAHKNGKPQAPFKCWLARPTAVAPKNAVETSLDLAIVGSDCVQTFHCPGLISSVTSKEGQIRRAKLECVQLVITSVPDTVTSAVWSGAFRDRHSHISRLVFAILDDFPVKATCEHNLTECFDCYFFPLR